jgi:RNA polymerase sigma-70 factor, ECF subfamily
MTESGRFEGIMGFVAQGDQSANVVALPVAPTNEFFALTQRVASGDDSAAREFFEKYCDRIFRYALVLARGEEEVAREILSLTMIKSARAMRPMASDDDAWRWLTRIARNCFVDHCRKRLRTIPFAQSNDAVKRAVAVSPDRTFSDALDEALSELPAGERELIERFYLDDESQAALANEVHSTRKAVESRLARIRRKLRAAILQKIR